MHQIQIRTIHKFCKLNISTLKNQRMLKFTMFIDSDMENTDMLLDLNEQVLS